MKEDVNDFSLKHKDINYINYHYDYNLTKSYIVNLVNLDSIKYQVNIRNKTQKKQIINKLRNVLTL